MINKTEQEIMKNWRRDKNTPVVSICCITYNHEKYIGDAIDSFLMQETDFPFEIIIDEDCSPDNTADVIRVYSEKYPDIIKANLRTVNVGANQNIMENMQRAKGKYIALCEGDDYWTDPLKLQKQVDFLEENLDYSVCYHSSYKVDEKGKKISSKTLNSSHDEVELISGWGGITTHTVMFRNVLTWEYSESKMRDSTLWHYLGFYGKGKFIKNISASAYRIHLGGIWSNANMRQRFLSEIDINKYIRNQIIKRIGNDSSTLTEHDLIYNRVFHHYLVYFIQVRNFKEYFYCLNVLRKQNELQRFKIYMSHIKKMFKRLQMKIFQ